MEITKKEGLEAELLIEHYGSRAAEEALAIAVEAFYQSDEEWAIEALRISYAAFVALDGTVPSIFEPGRFCIRLAL